MYNHFNRVLANDEIGEDICDFNTSKLLIDDYSESDYSSDSAVDSDVEFHLYSQVHYATNLDEKSCEPCIGEESVIETPDDDDVSQEGSTYASEVKCESTESSRDETSTSGIDKNDITLLKYFLDGDEEDDDFVPESWEIVDSVAESDSDDGGLDIHVSENKHDENSDAVVEERNDAWTPGKGPKTCWKIDKKDKASFKLESKGRYYGDIPNSMRCRNCNEVGHKARDCPEGKKKPVCFMCGERGHIGRDCPERQNHAFAKRYTECNRCGQEGHIRVNCPDLWRQFHITTAAGPIVVPEIPVRLNNNIQCYNCACEGHFGHECEESRSWMYYSVLMPLVCRYDSHAIVSEPQDLRKKLKKKERDNECSFSTKKQQRKQISEMAAREKRDRKLKGKEKRTESPKIHREMKTKSDYKSVKKPDFDHRSAAVNLPQKSEAYGRKIRTKQDSSHMVDEIWTKIRSDKIPKSTKVTNNDKQGTSKRGGSSGQHVHKNVKRDWRVDASHPDHRHPPKRSKFQQTPGQYFERDDVIVIDSTSGDDLPQNESKRKERHLGVESGNKQKIFDKKRKRSKKRSTENSPNPYLDFLNDSAPSSSGIGQKYAGEKRKRDNEDRFLINYGENSAKRRNFGKFNNSNDSKKRRYDNRRRHDDDRGFKRRFK